MKISGENVFSVPTENFAIGPTSTGFTLQYSVDGNVFSNYDDPVPANEVLVVTGVAKFLCWKLLGNTDINVTVLY